MRPIPKNKVKKNVDLEGAKRKSVRLRTMKIRDITGSGKEPDDPLVIAKE